MVSSASLAQNSVCYGSSCYENQGQNPINQASQPNLSTQVPNANEIANQIYAYMLQTAFATIPKYAPQLSACVGGLFLANGLNNLARPKAHGMYVLTNFAISAIMAAYAYNNQVENLAVLSQLFLGSALAMTFQRIKSLENDCYDYKVNMPKKEVKLESEIQINGALSDELDGQVCYS